MGGWGLDPPKRGHVGRMDLLVLLLLVAGAVCFGIAAYAATRVNLVALGLLCWVVTAILPALYRV